MNILDMEIAGPAEFPSTRVYLVPNSRKGVADFLTYISPTKRVQITAQIERIRPCNWARIPWLVESLRNHRVFTSGSSLLYILP